MGGGPSAPSYFFQAPTPPAPSDGSVQAARQKALLTQEQAQGRSATNLTNYALQNAPPTGTYKQALGQ